MKAADISSAIDRQRVEDYYTETRFSRLNDKRDGRIIVIHQRLHEDDLVGSSAPGAALGLREAPELVDGDGDLPTTAADECRSVSRLKQS